MIFLNYMDARSYFQKNKEKLDTNSSSKLAEALERLAIRDIFNKEDIEDLIDDVETNLDRIHIEKADMLINAYPEKYKDSVYAITPSYDVSILLLNPDSTSLVKEVERELYRLVLIKNDHNRTKTAKELGISIRTLRNKINEYIENGEVNEIELSTIRTACEESFESDGGLSAQNS